MLLHVGVSVYEDRHGRKLYNLNPDIEEYAELQKARRVPQRLLSRGHEPSVEDNKTPYGTIPHSDDDINLTVLTKPNAPTPRGYVTFPAGGPWSGQTVITLGQNADLSIFPHETGHIVVHRDPYQTLSFGARAHASAQEGRDAPGVHLNQTLSPANLRRLRP